MGVPQKRKFGLFGRVLDAPHCTGITFERFWHIPKTCEKLFRNAPHCTGITFERSGTFPKIMKNGIRITLHYICVTFERFCSNPNNARGKTLHLMPFRPSGLLKRYSMWCLSNLIWSLRALPAPGCPKCASRDVFQALPGFQTCHVMSFWPFQASSHCPR